MEKALVPVAEVTKAMTSQASQAAKPREEAIEPGPVLLKIPSMPPTPEASNPTALERLPTPSVSPAAMEAQPSSLTLASLSGVTAPLSRMVEISATMPPNTSVFWDAVLVERLMDFILLPRD